MRFLWAKNRKEERRPQLGNESSGYVFRRSRTITGTTSDAITTSEPVLSQLKSDRQVRTELVSYRRRILKLLGAVLLVCTFAGLLLSNLIVTPDVKTTTAVNGLDLGKYQQTITKYFWGHPLERFGFALKAGDLNAYLAGENTEVSNLSVKRSWYGGGVQFLLTFRAPLLVWQSGGQKFYVDGQGVAFRDNYGTEPSVIVKDQSGLPPDEEGIVASSRLIRFLGQTTKAINGYGKGRVSEIVIPASTREVDFKLDGRDYLIKTHTDRDPLQQAEDIANTLDYLDSKGIVPEYIDVRVAHRAYYK